MLNTWQKWKMHIEFWFGKLKKSCHLLFDLNFSVFFLTKYIQTHHTHTRLVINALSPLTSRCRMRGDLPARPIYITYSNRPNGYCTLNFSNQWCFCGYSPQEEHVSVVAANECSSVK
jgi:hypothetical protein